MTPPRRTVFDNWTRFRALAGAWERLKSHDLAPGVDGVRPPAFARTAMAELDALLDELRTGRYEPRALRCFSATDSRGKAREFSVPAFRDRVVQEAVRPALEVCLFPRLSSSCHGYVRGRSVLTAQHAAAAAVAAGNVWLHGADILSGFATVDRDRLQCRLQELLDADSAEIIVRILAAPRDRGGVVQPAPALGIPLGQPLSPSCFNVMLAPVDLALEAGGVTFVRYADDFLLMAPAPALLDRAVRTLDEALGAVGLRRAEHKDRRARVDGDPFPFLGRFLAADLVLEPVPAPPTSESPPPTAEDDATADSRTARLRTLYLQEDGAWVRRRHGFLTVQRGHEQYRRVPLRAIDRVLVLGGVSFSASALAACLEHGVPVHFVMKAGPQTAFGSLLRSDAESPLRVRSQMESHGDQHFRLSFARAIVRGKVGNARWLAKRLRLGAAPVRRLGACLRRLDNATSIDEVLGCEGDAAAVHYRALRDAIKTDIQFGARTRRPPRDHFNSLLSFGYTLLFNEMHTLLVEQRLSPFIGYLHALRDNHPALASDLIEEFRAPLVERFCIRTVNLREIQPRHFLPPTQTGAVLMTPEARRHYLRRWEEFMQAPLCREVGGSVLDARRTLDRQVGRLVDVVLSGSGEYVPFHAASEFCGRAEPESPPQTAATESAEKRS